MAAPPPRFLQRDKIIPGGGGLEVNKTAKSPLVFSTSNTFCARLHVEALSGVEQKILFPVMLIAVSDGDLAFSNYFKLIAPGHDRG
jgi:hypothetical protein